MTKTPPDHDPEIEALVAYMRANNNSGLGSFTDIEVVEDAPTRPQLISALVKEFKCLSCGEPFSRADCGSDSKGVFVSVKKCPLCKSELVVRQIESDWAAERKYDVSPEESILGPKPGKYSGLAAKKAFQSGKIKRKS